MTAAPLRVVIAPDSFKGSCSAVTAAQAIASGARAALGPAARLTAIPFADGGEGTLDALTAAWAGTIRQVETQDALGRPRTARFGISADGRTAIVEAAEANGLPWVSDLPLRALDADSFGVGVVLRAALEAGATELLVCLGGSATSDGGVGMLRSLGARFLRADGAEIAPGARGLSDLASADLTGILPAARGARWRIAVDVTNPLTGPEGAGPVFGPQKGATPEEVIAIDAGLARLARVLERSSGDAGSPAHLDARTTPGLGAAGGLALGPALLWGAELLPGAEMVAEAVGLDGAVRGADIVITGEGRLDAQSFDGKVVSRVLAASAQAPHRPRVVVIAGSVALSAAACREAGIAAAFSLARGAARLADLQAHAAELLADTAAQVCGLLAPEAPHHSPPSPSS